MCCCTPCHHYCTCPHHFHVAPWRPVPVYPVPYQPVWCGPAVVHQTTSAIKTAVNQLAG